MAVLLAGKSAIATMWQLSPRMTTDQLLKGLVGCTTPMPPPLSTDQW